MPLRRFARAAVLAASILAAQAGDPTARATALIEKAREASARGRPAALDVRVAMDPSAAFDAVDRLLREGTPHDGAVASALAAAYERSLGDDRPRRRVEAVRGWPAADRSLWLAALEDKDAAKRAFAAGRLDEAEDVYARVLPLFRSLGDACEEARSLTGLGAISAVRGESRRALERLDAARSAAERSGEASLVGAIELNRSYALGDLGRDEEALRALEEALAAGQRSRDTEVELRVLVNRGSVLEKLGRNAEAGEAFRSAVSAAAGAGDREAEANAWFNLAVLAQLAGDLEGQLEGWNRSLAIARKAGLGPLEAQTRIALAQVARRRGRFKEDREHLDAARRGLDGSNDPQMLADLELGEAHHRIEQGRFADAIPFLDAADRHLTGLDAVNLSSELHATRAVAFYYSGEYALAEAALRRALAEAEAVGNLKAEAERRANLGFVLFQTGALADGLAEIERAARIHEALGAKARRAHDLDLLGMLRFRAGDLAGARSSVEEALRAFDPAENPTGRAEALKDLAVIDLARGDEFRAAARSRLAEARRIVAAAGDAFGVLEISLLEADAASSDGDLRDAWASLARADDAARRTSAREFAWQANFVRGRLSESAGDRAGAARAYRRAIREVERGREGAERPAGRAAILEDRIAPYRALARLLREDGAVFEAWRVARAGKARTFVDRILPPPLDAETPGTGELGPEVLRAARGDPGPRTGTRGTLASDRLAPAPAQRLLSLLRQDEVLLDLFLEGNDLQVFVARPRSLVCRTLRLDGEVAGLLATARWPGRPTASDAPVTAAWRRAMRQLGEAIFAPLEPEIAGAGTLLIVPSGPLHGLPFTALETGGRRLLDRFDVTVLPAADALVSRTSRRRGFGLVAFGDPASSGDAARLPAAAEEARAIASGAPAAQAIVGAEATEALFRKRAPGAEVVHVAAHGRIDRMAPGRSHLLLAPGGGEDGRLEAAEIADLAIGASLVVLSGCATAVETGLASADAPADDLFGLPRAFLSAGAGHVVAALWEMDDDAGRAIMPRLHRELASRGAPAAVAALQRRISSAGPDAEPRGLDHPYYWAGIVAYGAGFEERAPSRSRSAR